VSRFPSLSVVMVAYNEQACLPAAAERTMAFLAERVEDPELVLVDDGSTDETGRLIDALDARCEWVRACHHDVNRGAGAALRTGFVEARGDWITIMPADGQIDPYEIEAFFAAAAGADLVLSNYRDRAGRSSLQRRALTAGFQVATLLILQTTIKGESIYVVRRELLGRLLGRLRSETFFLNIELPIRAEREGARLRSVLIDYHPRSAGRSKVTGAGRILRTIGEMMGLRVSLWRERLDGS
jgi:glycosyltransferase involved in cell wall biosynthesis